MSISMPSPILIVSGLRQEINVFVDQLENRRFLKVHGISCNIGDLRGHLCAVSAIGVGKVNAAMGTALLIAHFHPRMVICSGGSGGLNPHLQWGDTLIIEKTIQHDFGSILPEGKTRWPTYNLVLEDDNPLYLPTDPALTGFAINTAKHLTLPAISTRTGTRTPRILPGTLATGDVFITAPEVRLDLWQTLQADVLDMEGAAVVQVAIQTGVPCVIIRSVSDIDENVQQDWEAFFNVSIQNAAHIVTEMITALAR